MGAGRWTICRTRRVNLTSPPFVGNLGLVCALDEAPRSLAPPCRIVPTARDVVTALAAHMPPFGLRLGVSAGV